jgi:NAD(P)-dependent dehydrogenase (short-subunit alcohol dehydrogenase family)
MLDQGSGVIIFLTAIPARVPLPGSSGIAAAYGAVEAVMRTMAIELGPAGVRVVCLRTTANPDTRTIRDTTEVRAKMLNITPEQAMARLAEGTMLKVLPETADTAQAAAFLASDGARMMTGTVLNASAGAVTD